MECLSCKHTDSPEAFGSPAKCPQCGVYQDKARAHIERMEKAQAPAPDESVSRPPVNEPDSHSARHAGVQQVVVIDFRMSFWSMVKFMVKWAIAAIPALFLLILIGIFASSFLSGFLSNKTSGYSSPKSNGNSASYSRADSSSKDTLTFEVASSWYEKAGEGSGRLHLRLAAFNSSAKNIQAVEGRLSFLDVSGSTVGTVPFSASVSVPAYGSAWWDGTIFISSTIPGFAGLQSVGSSNRVSFKPRQLVYSDGAVENF